MSIRSNYFAALTVYWVAVLAYIFVPAFKTVLLFWYFPGWIVICLVGLGISYGFRCPSCDLPITLRRTPFNGLTLYGYSFWPVRRCTRCDEPLDD